MKIQGHIHLCNIGNCIVAACTTIKKMQVVRPLRNRSVGQTDLICASKTLVQAHARNYKGARYTVQQALRVQWRVFGVFVCFGLYFVNYRSWQAEFLQERAEGCIQVDLQKKIRQT